MARIKVRDRLVKASPGIMNWGEVFIQVKIVKTKLVMIKSIPLSDFIENSISFRFRFVVNEFVTFYHRKSMVSN